MNTYVETLKAILEKIAARDGIAKAKLRHYQVFELLSLACNVTPATVKKHYPLIKNAAVFDYDRENIWLK